ncbi:MAG: hypothetical protein WCP66_07825 [Methylococcales bacterium]
MSDIYKTQIATITALDPREPGDVGMALAYLCDMLQTADQRYDFLIERMKESNRMIAQNMIAIVRLEIASTCDAITNSILEVKREITKSGRAEVAINFTATLVMIAGNVMSGGGMTVIGAVLVAGGTALTKAAKNDLVGMVSATISGTAAGVAGGYDGNIGGQVSTGFAGQTPDPTSVDKNRADAIISSAQGVESMKALLMPDGAATPKGAVYVSKPYESKRKSTMFKEHGAGGAAAIIYDVQDAIAAAYYDACATLDREACATRDPEKPADGSILKAIVDATIDARSGGNQLHPLTKYILSNALATLEGGGGSKYQAAITMYPSDNGDLALRAAKRAYGMMKGAVNSNTPLPNSHDLIADTVIKNLIDSRSFF